MGSAGRPCATLRSTFHARAGAVPGDWPRLRRDRARHRSAVAVDRDAGSRRRGLVGPRARSRPQTHHRTDGPRLRVQRGPERVPILDGEPRGRGPQRVLPARLLPRLHAGLPLRPVGDGPPGRCRGVGCLAGGGTVADLPVRTGPQGARDPRRPRRRLAGLVDGPGTRRPRPPRARGRLRDRDEPGQLVRQRAVGPGRLVRGRLPPPRPARAVARPARASRDPHRHRRPHQAAARDPHPDRGRRHDPSGAVPTRRCRRGRSRCRGHVAPASWTA